jgi:hypothetical protein
VTVLAVEAPINMLDACTEFTALWARGLSKDSFWRLFVQCSLCRMVMPRDVFFSTHGTVGCGQSMGWSIDEGSHSFIPDNSSTSGDTEIIDWDELTDDETDDEVGQKKSILVATFNF